MPLFGGVQVPVRTDGCADGYRVHRERSRGKQPTCGTWATLLDVNYLSLCLTSNKVV